ncbi:peptide chain release factor 2 [Candidatus Parcubacteria bacterium]|nr:peptide chain release factor 2 [Candidatus Parcubacteria bacterium]
MQNLTPQIQELKNKLQANGEILNLEQKKQKLLELEEQMSQPRFWDNQENAKKISQQSADLRQEIQEFEDLNNEINNLPENNIEDKLEIINKKIEKLEFKTMLSNKYDVNNAILSIHAGTGGTDAQDWAEMLERMILRFCEAKKYKVNILDRQVGNEAGIKSVIFEIIGKWAYGYLQSEAGVHRLVRISPFDAEKMRHTSFALIEVLPELETLEEVELKDDDLEIDTFKSSGHGGQSVNTTDSAVRIKHKPTGLTATCQNERSQLQNKQTALKILASKLQQYNLAEQEEEKKKLRGEFSEAVWGNQIRSYVLHPYKLVKDHRTNFETQDAEKVLNGELDEFMESYLKWCAQRDLNPRPSA